MKKKVFSSELAYLCGIVILALGVIFMEKADFGMSMVVAPAYLVYLKVSETLPFFTFGMAEYAFQGLLLLLMIPVLRRFRLSYLFSFATAVFYGFVLDGEELLLRGLPADGIPLRICWYVVGLLLCSLGVSLLFHTYISPEVYELFVKEGSDKFGVNINRFKTGYDCASCLVGVILSFVFFGLWHFEGVKLGTILCALVNGTVIGLFSKLLENVFTFEDKLPLREFFLGKK